MAVTFDQNYVLTGVFATSKMEFAGRKDGTSLTKRAISSAPGQER